MSEWENRVCLEILEVNIVAINLDFQMQLEHDALIVTAGIKLQIKNLNYRTPIIATSPFQASACQPVKVIF